MSAPDILYIGCGPDPDIDPEARVVLVEPSPDHVPVIRGQVRGMGRRVRLIPAAVAAETGNATFHICNFADLSGLDVPAPLFELMPGLKQVKTAQVQTLSVADLLGQARIREDGYTLRCAAPGVVPLLLNQLLADGALDRIGALWLTVGAEPFHGPGSDAASVIATLRAQGYRLLAREDDADPDWPCLKFERDPALAELSRARDAAEAAKSALETERAGLLARLQESEAARQAAEAGAAAIRADLANVQDRARTVNTQRDRLEAELEAAREQAARLQSEAETAGEKLRAAQEARARAEAELEETRTAHAGLKAQLTEITTLQSRVEALAKDRDVQRAAAETARADLGMALRMQAMAAADLKDLQDRHAALSATKERQDALLGQLALQLGDVSEHLQQIEAAPGSPRLERGAAAKKGDA
ncbi:hypothetical protein AB9K34_21750 [Sedimentitalea sp. XS_ASV28]|uniref:hypothetical protein n=1 Tax=Sedimentitalea sp. XS_ASV28 TaxID=3241296 RepID=UPI0035170DD6